MINHWIFRCKDVSGLISQSMDKDLGLKVRIGIKLHLIVCILCSRYKRQMDLIRKAIKKLENDDIFDDETTCLPENARNKIKDYLNTL